VGAGPKAGLRLRHAFGEFGPFGAGQYWSPFVDPDVSPEIFESFRPPGQPFTRSVQVRWTPLSGDTRLTLALEKPGARADGGDYNDQIVERRVESRFPVPELVGSVRRGGQWGHVQVAGLWRRMWWDDVTGDQYDLTGSAAGYGVNLTALLRFGRHVVRVQYAAGRGIENYLNDSTADIAIRFDDGNPRTPLEGVALPVQAFTGYLESRLGPARVLVGCGRQAIDNVEGQLPASYHAGSYATATLVLTPAAGVTLATEYQWGRRENASDGWTFDDHRVQVSVRYRFSVAADGS